ncbi:unnamed protein product [Cyprideis torosa]|uniref:Uncharacterized protein n=1 Tax=Cyprideis torosa TaxID=163714 RepID=A0A7R8WCG5_9CRUS|nr:unnamed protein product [Cyprideis torosa]CAG0893345.1 unnamed protein product [Cyprideis torosa]
MTNTLNEKFQLGTSRAGNPMRFVFGLRPNWTADETGWDLKILEKQLTCRFKEILAKLTCRFKEILAKRTCRFKEILAKLTCRFKEILAKLTCRFKEILAKLTGRSKKILAKLTYRRDQTSHPHSTTTYKQSLLIEEPSFLLPRSKMVTVEVPSTMGYSVLVASGGVAMIFWMGMQVGKMRRSLKFGYPDVYHPTNKLFNCYQRVGKMRRSLKFGYPDVYHPTNKLFNCYQRVHQNTLELWPSFLVSLFIGTFGCPTVAPIAGTAWLAGRILFALGYYTGEPSNRTFGAAVTFLSMFTLMGCSAFQGYKMITA